MLGDRVREGLTFDDILIVPSASDCLPKDVSLNTNLIHVAKGHDGIPLAMPLLSAAMDTVTEASTALVMAQEGGIGIIHKNWSIEEQAQEVAKDKKYESGIVSDPITVRPDQTIGEVEAIALEQRISGFPVTRDKKLIGIITHRDRLFEEDMNKRVEEVMTPRERLVTAKPGIDVESAKSLLHKHRIEKLPIVDDKGNFKGLITVRDLAKVRKYPNATKDSFGRLRVGAAVGVQEADLERVASLKNAGVDVIVVDTAHGHSSGVINMVRNLRKEFPDLPIIAGNIATSEAAEELINAGASALKVGVGPGSICTTRVVAGSGVPQVTAIANVASVARKKNVSVIADGGIRYSGDIVKALAVGANAVMIGSLFGGTDESPGEVIIYQGRSYKVYRGMGSLAAMKMGSKDRYFQSDVQKVSKLVPEGIEGRVPYRGRLRDSLYQLLGGLRSGMGYAGCKDLQELATKTKFMRVTPAGLRESHVHDVIITKEAPNYSVE